MNDVFDKDVFDKDNIRFEERDVVVEPDRTADNLTAPLGDVPPGDAQPSDAQSGSAAAATTEMAEKHPFAGGGSETSMVPPEPAHGGGEDRGEISADSPDLPVDQGGADNKEQSSAKTRDAGSAEISAHDENVPEENDDEDVEEPVNNKAPLELINEDVADEDLTFDWYILKVAVNREDSIKDALLRRVKMNGLDKYFHDIVVPTEDVKEFTKAGKPRVVKKKLYPGYILINLSINDESWFVVRETPGIGDFTGAGGKPTPMLQKDVDRILKLSRPVEEGPGQVKTAIPFKKGDRVRVKEGYFQNFEGDVDVIDEANGRVTVLVNIFGRSAPVELDHWQIENV